jgi:hypothetical protein
MQSHVPPCIKVLKLSVLVEENMMPRTLVFVNSLDRDSLDSLCGRSRDTGRRGTYYWHFGLLSSHKTSEGIEYIQHGHQHRDIPHSVSTCSSAEDTASLAWLPNDDGFSIINEDAFLEGIIPVYFSMTQMRSFTRQLNLWLLSTRCWCTGVVWCR